MLYLQSNYQLYKIKIYIMKDKILHILSFILVCSLSIQMQIKTSSLQSLASQLASGLQYNQYDLKTLEGFNMDCLKAMKTYTNKFISVFHSSIEQKTSGYNALYLAEYKTDFLDAGFTKVIKLSERGSQGYLYEVQMTKGLLVLYELQNHSKGNTVAIRYYQTYEQLKLNNFVYEYQINQKIDGKTVRNIGTPSVEEIVLTRKEFDPKFNAYKLYIKFHYCPDGKTDLPGLGEVVMDPIRDFVDSKGQWIGGCKQNYSDWVGNADNKVQKAIARVQTYSKIGQRDLFTLSESGVTKKYYLYEVNINPTFNWKDWRIFLYSQSDDRAVQIPFKVGKDQDFANPHISLLSVDSATNQYQFFLSFFLPSEGVVGETVVKAGPMTAFVNIHP